MNHSLRTIGSGLVGAVVAIAILAGLRATVLRPTPTAPNTDATPQARSAPPEAEIVTTSPSETPPALSPTANEESADIAESVNLEITAPLAEVPEENSAAAPPTVAPTAAPPPDAPRNEQTPTATSDASSDAVTVLPAAGGTSIGNYLETIPPADGIAEEPQAEPRPAIAQAEQQTPPPSEDDATITKRFWPKDRNYLELIPPAKKNPAVIFSPPTPEQEHSVETTTPPQNPERNPTSGQPRIAAPDAPVPLPPPDDDQPSTMAPEPAPLPTPAPDTHPAVLARTTPAEASPPMQPAEAASTSSPKSPSPPPTEKAAPQALLEPLQRSVASARTAIEAKTPAVPPKEEAPPAEAAHAAMQAGDKALADGNTDEALRQFRHAHQLDPDNAEVLRGWAMALLVKQDFAQAVEVYRRLAELRPDDRTARYNLALALMREGEFFQAEEVYRQLLRDEPDFLDARVNLALLYQSQGKLSWAREQWQAVLQRDEDSAEAHALLAEVLLDLNRREEGMEHFARAAALQPKVASAWLNYAGAAAEVGSVGRAVAAMNRALHLAPQDAEAWRMLGDLKMELYRVTNDPAVLAEAVSAWEQSHTLDDTQADLARRIELYKPLTQHTTVGPPRP